MSKSEVKDSMGIDTRLGGFGVLFSGLLCVSVLIIAYYLYKSKNKEIKKIIILLTLLTLFIIIIISESWWARYNPTTYLILLMALLIVLRENKNKIVTGLFVVLIAINSGIIFSGNLYYSVSESIKIEHDFRSLKNKNINIEFNRLPVLGIVYNLRDYNIKYKFKDLNEKNVTYYKYLEYEVSDEK